MIWQPIDITDMAIRLGSAVLIGAIIGTNRHLHGQPAGLRTHAVVALASALAVLAFDAAGGSVDETIAAQSRVMQGILTGVGFIGAGVILHAQGHRIYGLTTAAAIWITATFGALCGAARVGLALCGVVIVLIVLIVGAPIEDLAQRLLGRKPNAQQDPDR